MSRLTHNSVVRWIATVVLAVTVAVAGPMAALAQPGAFVTLGASLLVQPMGGGEPLLIVSGSIPHDTPLPAQVALPVPEGSQVEWSGEIIGETIEEDIVADAVIEERDGGYVAVLTLTRSHIAQVEVVYPGATRPGPDGTTEASYEFLAPAPAESARIAIGLPPGSTATAVPEGSLAAAGPNNYTYYYTERSGVAQGEELGFTLGYTLPVGGTPPAPAGGPAGSEVPPLLVALVAAAIAGALLMLLAARARGRNSARMVNDESAGSQGGAPLTEDAADDDGFETRVTGESEEDLAGNPVSSATAALLSPRVLLIAAAVLILGIVMVMTMGGERGQVGVIDASNGWISQRVSTADAADRIEFSIIIPCACPPEEEAPKMFSALATVPGVATAALERDTLALRVEYDPTLTDADAIAVLLRSRGYLP